VGGVWKVEKRSESKGREVNGNVKGAEKRKEGGGKFEETFRRLYPSSDQSSSTS
jgi:hypothetical protein